MLISPLKAVQSVKFSGKARKVERQALIVALQEKAERLMD